MFVPAVSDRLVESALRHPADLLQIDLEDSVGPSQKEEARNRVSCIADRFSNAGRGVSVRVNRPLRLLVRDLEASVRRSVGTITVPKVSEPAFVRAVAEILSDLERERGIPVGHTRIIAMVEDADGIINMNKIARSHARLIGMMVGPEDLAVSMQMAVDDDSLYVPNVMAVAACRSAGIMPIGFIGSLADFKDEPDFRRRIQRARRLGFQAAFCVHPAQARIINEEFSPSPEEIAAAMDLIDHFEKEAAKGHAAFTYKGRMLEAPIVDQARNVLKRHQALVAGDPSTIASAHPERR